MDRYSSCGLCPRNCRVDRRLAAAPNRGFCGETADLRIASASIHRGEEPPVTGNGGSGAIFITGCTLGCGFCQNWQISRDGMGRVVSALPTASSTTEPISKSNNEFVRICLALQEKGAENINIVTGSHAVPALVSGIRAARERGLFIPVLWNSSAYESLDALSLLRDTVDVYLPDLKTLDRDIARRFFKAPDYPETAEAAILRMLEYRGTMQFGASRSGGVAADGAEKASASGVQEAAGDGQVLLSGVIIRHLVLPDYLDATRAVLRWFADHAQGRALLSLMTQYTPVKPGATDCSPMGVSPMDYSPTAPARYINQQEYETLLGWLEEFGIEDGFYQELVPDNDWLPDFTRKNPFSSTLSQPVWHWKAGFVTD